MNRAPFTLAVALAAGTVIGSAVSLAVGIAVGVAVMEGDAGAVEDLLTPRSIAMGDSLRADASGALGPLLNPAGMALRKAYTLEAMYGFRVEGLESDVHLSVVDSTTSKLAAGVYYSFVHGTPALHIAGDSQPLVTLREGSETGLALALPLGDRFVLGTTLKYMHVTTTVPNPMFNAIFPSATIAPRLTLADSSTGPTDGFTFDLGAIVRAGDTFTIAAVGYNLIPMHTIEAPASVGGGFAWKPKDTFTLAIDVLVDLDKYQKPPTATGAPGGDLTTVRVGGGLEYLAAGKVALRAGTAYDNGRPGYYVSAGIAYVDTRFAFDLGYRQQLVGGLESYIVAGIRIFLQ